jgi:hypothetical protein
MNDVSRSGGEVKTVLRADVHAQIFQMSYCKVCVVPILTDTPMV